MASATSRAGVSGSAWSCRQQALLERARADAGRLEPLHQAQRGGEVLGVHVVLGGHQRRELLEADLEVAVVVQAVDDHVGEGAIALAHLRDHQLLAQVLLQLGSLRWRADHSSCSRSPPDGAGSGTLARSSRLGPAPGSRGSTGASPSAQPRRWVPSPRGTDCRTAPAPSPARTRARTSAGGLQRLLDLRREGEVLTETERDCRAHVFLFPFTPAFLHKACQRRCPTRARGVNVSGGGSNYRALAADDAHRAVALHVGSLDLGGVADAVLAQLGAQLRLGDELDAQVAVQDAAVAHQRQGRRLEQALAAGGSGRSASR